MLTRLKVRGFKNLQDIDVRFGPFTCIAGANGVGKSNLFDAIVFLSSLTSRSLNEAAMEVRDSRSRTTDIRSLFFNHGKSPERRMRFEAEMVVPQSAVDELGQLAQATTTFLKYSLELAYIEDSDHPQRTKLHLKHEELTHVKLTSAVDHLWFPHDPVWRESAITGSRRGAPYISTLPNDQIRLHQDGKSGQPRSFQANTLPRTVLSSVNAQESPTALLAKREMESWRLLQLEPSALRSPDPYNSPVHIGIDGSHCPATLFHLMSQEGESLRAVNAKIGNRLAELVDGVRDVAIDQDSKRELLTLMLTDKDGKRHAARALSDGTLRFLALSILEQDPDARGVICLEEPENGIHPARIPVMLRLLRELSLDPTEPVGADNPLRQVIVNTHSPKFVEHVTEDELLIAEPYCVVDSDGSTTAVRFAPMSRSWWHQHDHEVNTGRRGDIEKYLSEERIELPSAEPPSGRVSRPLTIREAFERQMQFSFEKPTP